jgi:hypothetical protein
VNTAITPGIAVAADVSMAVTTPWATVDLT